MVKTSITKCWAAFEIAVIPPPGCRIRFVNESSTGSAELEEVRW